jgi:hypothetical protein
MNRLPRLSSTDIADRAATRAEVDLAIAVLEVDEQEARAMRCWQRDMARSYRRQLLTVYWSRFKRSQTVKLVGAMIGMGVAAFVLWILLLEAFSL